MATIGTFNEEGVNVDLYIPRKCHATNTLIPSYDHSAVQITIANVDANGVADGTTTTFCIAGYLRAQGESDHAINHLAINRGIVRIKTGKKPKAKKVKGKGKGTGAPNKGVHTKGAPAKGQKGKTAVPQKGAKPQGNKGARPQGHMGARPQGSKGQAPRRTAPVRK